MRYRNTPDCWNLSKFGTNGFLLSLSISWKFSTENNTTMKNNVTYIMHFFVNTLAYPHVLYIFLSLQIIMLIMTLMMAALLHQSSLLPWPFCNCVYAASTANIDVDDKDYMAMTLYVFGLRYLLLTLLIPLFLCVCMVV